MTTTTFDFGFGFGSAAVLGAAVREAARGEVTRASLPYENGHAHVTNAA
jgi:hypothetical protein